MKIVKRKNFQKTFKNINYDIKKKINIDYIKKLQSYSIKDILIIDISSKYKTLPKNLKFKINEICNSSKWLEKYLTWNIFPFLTIIKTMKKSLMEKRLFYVKLNLSRIYWKLKKEEIKSL